MIPIPVLPAKAFPKTFQFHVSASGLESGSEIRVMSFNVLPNDLRFHLGDEGEFGGVAGVLTSAGES
jgi:hypothetical protein